MDPRHSQLAHVLATINKLQLKSFNATSKENLAFIILNDTYQLIKYDKSLLWSFENEKPTLLGISGQHKIYDETEISQKWNRLISHLENPEQSQKLTRDSFSQEQFLWDELFPSKETSVYWLPIKIEDKLRLGFWMERTESEVEQQSSKETLDFLAAQLIPAYASAWNKFSRSNYLRPMIKKHKLWYYGLLTLLTILFVVRIPLRVVAPCEIVPANSIVITAPLDGIINQILVKPGQEVNSGQVILDYDKRLPDEELRVAQKQVEISKADLNRASTMGISDPKSLAELEILKLKLQKDQISLDFNQSQISQLDVKAPRKGIVMIDDPDEWRGKPVKIGMKIMTINDPNDTKLKLWIPENDNVVIDRTQPLKVFLNVAPDREFKAKLDYISYESTIGEDQVPSFVGEAQWETPPKEIKLGQKGTAILYGDRVSLFYYIIRKPWSTIRNILSI